MMLIPDFLRKTVNSPSLSTAYGLEEPVTYADVQDSPHRSFWKNVMACELHVLTANNPFSPITQSPGYNVVGESWVYRWKANQFREAARAKECLAAKGYSQKKGINCFQTFSPTPTSASIRLAVCIALNNDLNLFHFDAEQAFV